MKTTYLAILLLLGFSLNGLKAQDTFSIVALDSVTGEVGSAGASCVDLNNWSGYDDDFLGELFPGVGAINTQAWYHPTNQANARNRMNQGETPSEIIDWLVNNDVSGQPQLRQYGIVAMVENAPESAAHTGASTDDYKGHLTGPNYSIQGNILLGPEVLDSMEARFLRAEGDLACKLMAAMQGANMVGADSRCANNGTSSLFAFLKVAQPDDEFGEPSFLLSVRTEDNAGIEPIDSLQILFDEVHSCSNVGILDEEKKQLGFDLYPNPAHASTTLKSHFTGISELCIFNPMGNIVLKMEVDRNLTINTSDYPNGMYFLRLSNDHQQYTRRLIIHN